MKEKWQKKKLGELCNISIGKTPLRGNKAYWDPEKKGDNVWLSIADLNNTNGKIVKDSKEYISDKGSEKCKIIKKGTLLVSFKLTLGRLAFAGRDLYTNEAIASLQNDQKEIINDFLYYYLTFFDWDYYAKDDHKVKGKTLNKKKISDIYIIYPDIKKQKEIVKYLDETFDKINDLKVITQNQKDYANNLFQSSLDYYVNEYKKGNCKTHLLGEVCKLTQGLAINAKTKHYLVKKSKLPLLRIKDLRTASYNQYVDDVNYPKNCLVEKDDLIYTRTGQIGLVFRGFYGVLHNNSFKVEPNDELDKDFLFWWLQNSDFKKKITSLASRAAQPDITHKLFKKQIIGIPPINDQKEISKKIKFIKEHTSSLAENYNKKEALIKELVRSVMGEIFYGQNTK